ncbi:hypothetical protein ES702_03175 [subsurface metagenome]
MWCARPSGHHDYEVRCIRGKVVAMPGLGKYDR